MQLVWVVYYSDHFAYSANYEDGWVTILGVFSTKELADKRLEKEITKYPSDKDCYFILESKLINTSQFK